MKNEHPHASVSDPVMIFALWATSPLLQAFKNCLKPLIGWKIELALAASPTPLQLTGGQVLSDDLRVLMSSLLTCHICGSWYVCTWNSDAFQVSDPETSPKKCEAVDEKQ